MEKSDEAPIQCADDDKYPSDPIDGVPSHTQTPPSERKKHTLLDCPTRVELILAWGQTTSLGMCSGNSADTIAETNPNEGGSTMPFQSTGLTNAAQQPSQVSAQPTTGKTPPAELTSKDVAYLEDQMSWLLTAAKKCRHLATECTDTQVQSILGQVCETHERQYQTLLQCCQSHAQTGQQAQAGLH